MALAASLGFVQEFEGLQQVALEGAEGGADGWGAKAMSEQAEVGQAALNPGLQTWCGPTRTQRRPVLGHEVNKLFADLPEGKEKVKVSAQSSDGLNNLETCLNYFFFFVVKMYLIYMKSRTSYICAFKLHILSSHFITLNQNVLISIC